MRIKPVIMPERIRMGKRDDTYGKFSLSPLERGYGITIGHALRRLLLSSIQGAAITAINIQGIMHEFSTIKDVKEDVAEIILNLKKIRMRYIGKELPQYVTLEKEGPGEVRALDIVLTPDLEIANPDQLIATMGEEVKIMMKLRVDVGKGFVSRESFSDSSMPEGTIYLDTNFSPVKRVKYHIDNVRVGQRTDFEELIIEIWTDGSVHPDEALNLSAKIMSDHLKLFIEEGVFVEGGEEEKEDEKERIRKLLNMPVEELGMGNRVMNVLKKKNIHKLNDLVVKLEEEMLKYPNFGKVSLKEVKDRLKEYDLVLNMDPTLYFGNRDET